MDKGKVLRTDFQVQAASMVALIGIIGWSGVFGQGMNWLLLLLSLLVIWQFFSGIYIASEFKMLYRGVPPGALLILVTLCILFAAADFTMGLLIGAYLFPLILLSNVVLAVADWYRWHTAKKSKQWQLHQETILDTDDMF